MLKRSPELNLRTLLRHPESIEQCFGAPVNVASTCEQSTRLIAAQDQDVKSARSIGWVRLLRGVQRRAFLDPLSSRLMETALYYTLSTIAQTLAGALAILVAVSPKGQLQEDAVRAGGGVRRAVSPRLHCRLMPSRDELRPMTTQYLTDLANAGRLRRYHQRHARHQRDFLRGAGDGDVGVTAQGLA